MEKEAVQAWLGEVESTAKRYLETVEAEPPDEWLASFTSDGTVGFVGRLPSPIADALEDGVYLEMLPEEMQRAIIGCDLLALCRVIRFGGNIGREVERATLQLIEEAAQRDPWRMILATKAIMQALDAANNSERMREYIRNHAARAGSGRAWYTIPLAEMCKRIKRRYRFAKREELFRRLPDQPCMPPIGEIRLVDDELELYSQDRDLKVLSLKAFRNFCTRHKI